MSDAVLVLNPGVGGDLEDVEQLIGAGAQIVIRQRLQVAGSVLAEIARVINTAPVGDEYGLVVRLAGEAVVNPRTSNAPGVTFVAASLANTTLLAGNINRRNATFFNTGSGNLYLKIGTAAALNSFTVRLQPGGYYELPVPIWDGSIDGFWDDAAAGGVAVTELT